MIDTSVVAILITLLIAVIGVSFGYGLLTDKVKNHQIAIEKLENSYKDIDEKLDLIANRLTSIESALREKDKQQGN